MVSPMIAGVKVSVQKSTLHKIRAARQITHIYTSTDGIEQRLFILHQVTEDMPHVMEDLRKKMESQQQYLAAGFLSQEKGRIDEAIENYEKGIQHSENPEEGNICFFFALELIKNNYGTSRAARFSREHYRPDIAKTLG